MRDRFIAWYHHLARKAGDGRGGKRFDRVCHNIRINQLCHLPVQDRGRDYFKVSVSGSLYYYVFGLFANQQMGFLKIRGHQANISTRFAKN